MNQFWKLKHKWGLVLSIIGLVVGFLVVGFTPWLFFSCHTDKVTRENVRSLEFGMSEKQVEAVLGPAAGPWDSAHLRGITDKAEIWIGDGTAYIRFSEGRVVELIWEEEGFSSETKENFERLTIGMTLAQVNGAVGKPPFHILDFEKNPPGDGRTIAYWRDIDGIGTAVFKNQQLSSRRWSGSARPPEADRKTCLEMNIRRWFGLD